ncbi:phage tail fiber domain-containing protein, partial [Desulfovibrio piger]|uniref:phage tail fiber domain-containing protein n=1 Tax=Desulfovibrio piger TaxID=901 RepID=UPI0026E9D23F
MAYSYVTYTGDGSTQIYTVPFPFIKQEDIHVFLDAEEVPAERIEWLSESSIKFDMPPEQGAVIRIRRDTDKEEAVVDFHDGSVLSEEDLDQNTRQLLFIAQEAYDALEGSPTIDNDNKWDMRGLPIKNVGPAEDPDDAVNYRQYSTDMLPTLQDLQQKTAQSEANAKASEVAAAQSRQAAATSQTAAKGSEADAKASKEAAAESARQAEDWTERAKAWAESPTPPDPDDPESKSAKEWAKAASDTVPIATPSIAGKVMPQTGDEDGLELGEDGSLRVRKATTTQRGSVLASTTAAANTVPQAGEDGTLDASWVPRPDYWDMFPPFVPVPIWGATPGGSDGRRAVMPG